MAFLNSQMGLLIQNDLVSPFFPGLFNFEVIITKFQGLVYDIFYISVTSFLDISVSSYWILNFLGYIYIKIDLFIELSRTLT